MTEPRLSCIVPAYNEAPRIGAVLDVALASTLIDEVIVVDDGSSDGTAEVAERHAAKHLRVLRQPQNGGKTRAVARGVEEAQGELVMLLDSDLLGLTPTHLDALIAPVTGGRAGASVSLRENAPWAWRVIGLDYISGERVMPRALLANELEALANLPRFGLEVFMNRIWIEEALPLAVVDWPGVESPLKSTKRGGLAGITGDVRMLEDIFHTITPREALEQIRSMRELRI